MSRPLCVHPGTPIPDQGGSQEVTKTTALRELVDRLGRRPCYRDLNICRLPVFSGLVHFLRKGTYLSPVLKQRPRTYHKVKLHL